MTFRVPYYPYNKSNRLLERAKINTSNNESKLTSREQIFTFTRCLYKMRAQSLVMMVNQKDPSSFPNVPDKTVLSHHNFYWLSQAD